jgi:ElaB/YqjD/DUF883 family membrane-anchored ribosome-binding protein
MSNKSSDINKKEGVNIKNVRRSVIAGDVSGSIQNIHNSSIGKTQAERDELQRLIEELRDALQEIPPEQADDAEAVRLKAEDLLTKANTDNPNKKVLQIEAEGLKKAAENIASVAGNVVSVAEKIIAIVLRNAS